MAFFKVVGFCHLCVIRAEKTPLSKVGLPSFLRVRQIKIICRRILPKCFGDIESNEFKSSASFCVQTLHCSYLPPHLTLNESLSWSRTLSKLQERILARAYETSLNSLVDSYHQVLPETCRILDLKTVVK